MCGIAGILNFDLEKPASRETIERMCAVTRHRGPDDHGVHLDGPVGLGFNRLSIIDLAGGHQPMSNEDGSVWVVFNGEIYNFQELRADLRSRGHVFATRSDTETIVHAWEEFGEECVSRLRGMFAFVVWDARRRLLFGARDRLGIKPFYYFHGRDFFAFASELKSLVELDGAPREIEPAALPGYLRHRYVIGPRTMLKGVRKLLPGECFTVRGREVKRRRYWRLRLDGVRRIPEREALERFEALMDETLRQHLIADVPLGAFLSGGLDSSAVVAWMAKLGVADIKTFSIGYDSPESELPYARLVSRRFGADHHEVVLTPGEFAEDLPRIVSLMDEPVADEAALPLFHIARLARRTVTVALSGEGSDEIFGGYPIYRTMMTIEALNRIPLAGAAGRVFDRFADGKLRKYGRMLGKPIERRYGGVSTAFPEHEIPELLAYEHFPAGEDPIIRLYREADGLPLLHRMAYVDMNTWLADDLLVKADRMSMANSLELRVPFLDHKVVEFVYSLPVGLKIRGARAKYLLKKSMEGRLPRRIIHRPKKGFPVPLESWFRDRLAAYARDVLFSHGSGIQDHFRRGMVEEILRQHETRDRSNEIYALLVFALWHRRYVCRAD